MKNIAEKPGVVKKLLVYMNVFFLLPVNTVSDRWKAPNFPNGTRRKNDGFFADGIYFSFEVFVRIPEIYSKNKLS